MKQKYVTKILTSVFNTLYTHVEFRKVKPVDYKIFQDVDLICTMELLSEKAFMRNRKGENGKGYCGLRKRG